MKDTKEIKNLNEWMDLFNKIENKELYDETIEIINSLDKAKLNLIENAVFLDDFGDKLVRLERIEKCIKDTIEYINDLDISDNIKNNIISKLKY